MGRLVVISFHSLEDRLVKRFMKRNSEIDPAFVDFPVIPPNAEPRLRLVGRKRRAVEAEVESNPRARSALLRVAEKLK
jgi:16S rRNA (cytosine1402-N4)-methyltransferase